MSVPVYLFLGFLESGKTTFIQETLADPSFHTGEKTLLLLCEEGIEEFEPDKFAADNVNIVTVDSPEQLTEKFLLDAAKQNRAERVLIEYNGMWEIQKLADVFPKKWEMFQMVMTADASTFPGYLQNVRQLAVDKLQVAEMVIFNRTDDTTDRGLLHRSVRMVNRGAQMMFEYRDGSVAPDDIIDEPPFDTSGPDITVGDEDFGLWYLDAMDHPDKYDGKTMHFKAMTCITEQVPKNCFVPGRFCMTCCEADITFVGFICDVNGHSMPKHRSWIDVTATVSVKYHPIYEGEGPWLTLTDVKYDAAPAKEEVVTFM